jgi:hypothetical protein
MESLKEELKSELNVRNFYFSKWDIQLNTVNYFRRYPQIFRIFGHSLVDIQGLEGSLYTMKK